MFAALKNLCGSPYSLCTLLLIGYSVSACVSPETDRNSLHDNETIANATTWEGIHEIRGNLTINAPLNLKECTVVMVGAGATIHVRDGGAIKALGTEECPVVFRSAHTLPKAGDWNGIHIYANADNDSTFKHTTLGHGGSDVWGTIWLEGGASVSLSDVLIHDSEHAGIRLEGGANLRGFDGVKFEKMNSELLYLEANEVGSLESLHVGENVASPRIYVSGGAVSQNAKWRYFGAAYEMHSIRVEALLELDEGVHVHLAPGVSVQVREGGSIQTHGTEEAPVVIQSSKRAPASGDWEYIDIYSSASNDNILRWTTVRHGGQSGTWGAIWVEDGANLILDHVTFEQNKECDVYEAGSVTATDSTYKACAH